MVPGVQEERTHTVRWVDQVAGARNDQERSSKRVPFVTGPAERQIFLEVDVQRLILVRGECPGSCRSRAGRWTETVDPSLAFKSQCRTYGFEQFIIRINGLRNWPVIGVSTYLSTLVTGKESYTFAQVSKLVAPGGGG